MPRFGYHKKNFMTAGSYFVVAAVIRKISDPTIRKNMADHFATEFNRRSKSFDPYEWEKATGGKPSANSAA